MAFRNQPRLGRHRVKILADMPRRLQSAAKQSHLKESATRGRIKHMPKVEQAHLNPAPLDAAEYEFDVTTALDQFPLSIRWGGCEIMDYAKPIETPSFTYALIKLCISGAGTFETDTERWQVSVGDVFWSGPYQPTTLTCSRELGMTNFAMALSGSECEREISNYLHASAGVLKLRDAEQVRSIIEAIMAEGRGNSDHRDDVCALLAKVMLRRIDAQSQTPLTTHALARQTFKRCRDYIEQHFATVSSLRTVAEACEVTVPYLCRLFDQFFDCGPYEYMTRLKMNRAESLLLRPSMPIGEVASAVGYKDPRLFARNFKVAFGKTPTKYRHALMPPAER